MQSLVHHVDFTLLRPEVPLEAGVEHGLASGAPTHCQHRARPSARAQRAPSPKGNLRPLYNPMHCVQDVGYVGHPLPCVS